MHPLTTRFLIAGAVAAGLAGCAGMAGPDYDALMASMLKS